MYCCALWFSWLRGVCNACCCAPQYADASSGVNQLTRISECALDNYDTTHEQCLTAAESAAERVFVRRAFGTKPLDADGLQRFCDALRDKFNCTSQFRALEQWERDMIMDHVRLMARDMNGRNSKTDVPLETPGFTMTTPGAS